MEAPCLSFSHKHLFCLMSIESLLQNSLSKMAAKHPITGFASRLSSHVGEVFLFFKIYMISLMTVLLLCKNTLSNHFLSRVTNLICVCMQ